MSGNDDQRDFWTDNAGPIWVEQRANMDMLLAPVLQGTLERAALRHGQEVIDIGCGAGTSTLATADIVGDAGQVTGIDISATLLADAQKRSSDRANIAYLMADAQTHTLAPSTADAIISRFGVMFFDDSVAAFRNLTQALRPKGLISFSAWGAIEENPFFTLPARVARRILGPVPKSDPDSPGPFAFRDPAYVANLMGAAGLEAEIDVAQEYLVLCDGARAVAETWCHIGPAHSALLHYKATKSQRAELIDALVDALTPFTTASGTSIPAQINYVTARKST